MAPLEAKTGTEARGGTAVITRKPPSLTSEGPDTTALTAPAKTSPTAAHTIGTNMLGHMQQEWDDMIRPQPLRGLRRLVSAIWETRGAKSDAKQTTAAASRDNDKKAEQSLTSRIPPSLLAGGMPPIVKPKERTANAARALRTDEHGRETEPSLSYIDAFAAALGRIVTKEPALAQTAYTINPDDGKDSPRTKLLAKAYAMATEEVFDARTAAYQREVAITFLIQQFLYKEGDILRPTTLSDHVERAKGIIAREAMIAKAIADGDEKGELLLKENPDDYQGIVAKAIAAGEAIRTAAEAEKPQSSSVAENAAIQTPSIDPGELREKYPAMTDVFPRRRGMVLPGLKQKVRRVVAVRPLTRGRQAGDAKEEPASVAGRKR